MDDKIKRYYQLKNKHKEMEQEIADLRSEIVAYCHEQQATELEAGSYRVKLVLQERKEYDESKLYEALPDPQLWRLLAKPDTAKIQSLIKLNVLSEEKLQDTYAVKNITLLHVDKK
ncbi:cell division septum initiation protein DivIVA [Paenibacillus phyllosphaerae]|uniref:Cell division septum initiation protein DivIVA n=1 Tax=Paenibacillus phyllosphaerae TaxID=274593 RepID=A0A7W5FRQ7_9BACL|nr:hypothetical protein [Paenibacillus phyllosphaerae]MBB3114552.1 cell division septum initiation protein DivIVA [Paenibacillus phyllosphaerae]